MDAHHHGAMPGLAAPELAHRDVVDLPPLGTAAARAVVNPTSEKAPDAANDEGQRANAAPQVQTQNQHLHFASDGAAGKALATMHELANGGYLVGKWNYSKAVPCLRAVGDLLRQIGGR